jgi:hypothetical protein
VPTLQVCFAAGADAGTTHISVAVYHDGAPSAGGRRLYKLKVTDASGATLVDFTGTASYEGYRPNGAGCDPLCKTAELAF